MNHFVLVKLVGGAVHAEPNPLPEVRPGDNVVWLLDDKTVGEKELRVEFQEIRALLADGSAPLNGAKIRRCGKKGPFNKLLARKGWVLGTVSPDCQGRFIYKFFDAGVQVRWKNRLPGDENFGGVDVPPPPPRGV